MLIILATLIGDCETMINGEYNPIKLAKVINCLSQGKCREIAVIRKRSMIIRVVEVGSAS
jgi:hypothetical protein